MCGLLLCPPLTTHLQLKSKLISLKPLQLLAKSSRGRKKERERWRAKLKLSNHLNLRQRENWRSDREGVFCFVIAQFRIQIWRAMRANELIEHLPIFDFAYWRPFARPIGPLSFACICVAQLHCNCSSFVRVSTQFLCPNFSPIQIAIIIIIIIIMPVMYCVYLFIPLLSFVLLKNYSIERK